MAKSSGLRLIATKLGLGEEEKVLRKAEEFERLLEARSTAGNNLNDTSKVVICLDLAASTFSTDLDQKTAIKYSGLKGRSYSSSRKVIENLLGLNDDILTLSTLCLTLQCTGAKSLAETILQEYQKNSKREVDLSLPQYVCMAVYHACRLKKIKVGKSKFIEKSRLKPGQWSKLDTEWTKFVDERFASESSKGRPHTDVAITDNITTDLDSSPKEKQSVETKNESYEDWKRRMLEKAYKELEQLEKAKENKESLKAEVNLKSPRRTPRKSPRKTPQKTPLNFSPSKSPKKGVRHLFPTEQWN
ncbi:unnamed protein product [Leptidea sinapis]|uniref:Origin recognition complex subunit 6 n=1 Tax=Leptidea sinapis TaxID=189913 RepID=A0A5E4PN01_9NEOP|nr:unnamed protein product [Leptidea sinapis]